MIPTLYFRFGTEDAYGCTKIPLREARKYNMDDDIEVRSVVQGRRGAYRDVTVVGTNRYCKIIDISDLKIPIGSHCIMMCDGPGRFTILCC